MRLAARSCTLVWDAMLPANEVLRHLRWKTDSRFVGEVDERLKEQFEGMLNPY